LTVTARRGVPRRPRTRIPPRNQKDLGEISEVKDSVAAFNLHDAITGVVPGLEVANPAYHKDRAEDADPLALASATGLMNAGVVWLLGPVPAALMRSAR
jgi:hypothetical protein